MEINERPILGNTVEKLLVKMASFPASRYHAA